MSGNVPSFLSRIKNDKNGFDAMTSIRQNPKSRIKKKNLFSFSHMTTYLFPPKDLC